MKKPKVLFPATEAGLGHIVPMKAIADAFEKKYGDRCEIVRTRFFADSGNPHLIAYERSIAKEVVKHNKNHHYGYFCNGCMNFFGTRLTSWASMRGWKPKAFRAGRARMEELAPDLVFSTHWVTNYYAQHARPKPITVQFCPDAVLNRLFEYPADLTLVTTKRGYEDGLRRRRRYNEKNFKQVPFLIRGEAFEIPFEKAANRRALGLPEDKFTVVLAEGGYGIGKMTRIVELLVKSHLPVTVVPVCGKNEELFEYFKTLEVCPEVTFAPMGFCTRMLEVIASADLFCGKGGNILAEPCFFGVPIIVTKFATRIEKNIARHYIKEIGCAMKEFKPERVVEMIADFQAHPEKLIPMREAALSFHDEFGADRSADVIWELLQERFPELKDAPTEAE